MPLYSADNYINVTVVDGLTFVGRYASDGSLNVIPSDGSSFVGIHHPSGAMYVTVNESDTPYSRYAADGSIYVTETGLNNGALKINVVSGTFGFDPADLTLRIWLDPSDLSTMWQDVARTTPVTADGQLVASIFNKGTLGDYFIQATVAARPIYRTSGGLHWLEFDGVDDILVNSIIWNDVFATAGTSNVHTAVLGAQYDTINTNAATTVPYNNDGWVTDNTSGNQSHGIGRSGGPTVGVGGRILLSSYYTLEDTYTLGTPFIVTSHHASGTHTVRVNSVGSAGTDQVQAVTNQQLSGGALAVGKNYGGTTWSQGKFFGYIATAADLSSDLNNLRTYMAAKSGVTL